MFNPHQSLRKQGSLQCSCLVVICQARVVIHNADDSVGNMHRKNQEAQEAGGSCRLKGQSVGAQVTWLAKSLRCQTEVAPSCLSLQKLLKK